MRGRCQHVAWVALAFSELSGSSSGRLAAASELIVNDPSASFARLHLCRLLVAKAVRRHHNKDLLEHLMTSLKTTPEKRERDICT